MVDYMKRYFLFGFPVDAFVKHSLLCFITECIESGQRTVIANLNLHALYCLLKYPDMQRLLQRHSTKVHVDGMPIVWLLRAQGEDATADMRLTYLGWAEDMIALAHQNAWKVAYLGSTPDICEKGVRYHHDKYPGLILRGWDGYFDMADNSPGSRKAEIIREINEMSPDILIVGMGMPRQEAFLQENYDSMNFRVGLCSGAFFEYYVGGQAMPPRVWGNLGLEWLYRLLKNPRRYAHRYLVEPWLIAFLLVKRRFQKPL